ncbi:RNA polymerase sigma factor RpoS [Yersinia enterocolitica]|nr:RNA polymerase sigma factor RpoS [Yersinia enterocolitica]
MAVRIECKTARSSGPSFCLLGYEAATLEDVGREIGLTRERVRQIQVEGLRRLREILQAQGLSIEALFRE